MTWPLIARLCAAVLLSLTTLMAAGAAFAQKAYVADQRGYTVSVIDAATNTLSNFLDVGGRTAGVAVTPDGTHVNVTNWDSNVSVIDVATDTVTATVNVGGVPCLSASSLGRLRPPLPRLSPP